MSQLELRPIETRLSIPPYWVHSHKSEIMMSYQRGSVWSAMAWMVGLSVVLFWLPIIGGLTAGYVGGVKAGSPGKAIFAALLPGFLFTIIVMLLGAFLGWIPLIGHLWAAAAGMGAAVLGTMQVLPLLIGAGVGGMKAQS